jgi:hypothetical protein
VDGRRGVAAAGALVLAVGATAVGPVRQPRGGDRSTPGVAPLLPGRGHEVRVLGLPGAAAQRVEPHAPEPEARAA